MRAAGLVVVLLLAGGLGAAQEDEREPVLLYLRGDRTMGSAAPVLERDQHVAPGQSPLVASVSWSVVSPAPWNLSGPATVRVWAANYSNSVVVVDPNAPPPSAEGVALFNATLYRGNEVVARGLKRGDATFTRQPQPQEVVVEMELRGSPAYEAGQEARVQLDFYGRPLGVSPFVAIVYLVNSTTHPSALALPGFPLEALRENETGGASNVTDGDETGTKKGGKNGIPGFEGWASAAAVAALAVLVSLRGRRRDGRGDRSPRDA